MATSYSLSLIDAVIPGRDNVANYDAQLRI
ncbi:hypothetical protein ACVWXO_003677 [Bradyrhizobium sp. LM2.7]